MPNEKTLTPDKPLATVVLAHPVTFGTEVYKVLEFHRRLKARDFFGIKIGGMKFDDYLTLISRAANVPAPVLEEMDAEDFQSACLVCDSFLSSGPATGTIA
jgi:hypothetical protein